MTFMAFCFNFILVESLYVSMGFGLYINSRVEVEGWDLKLLFQKFSNSRTKSRGVRATAKTMLLVFFVLFGLFGMNPLAVYSDDLYFDETAAAESIDDDQLVPVNYFPDNFPVPSAESLDKLQEVLASPDFGTEKESWYIKFRKTWEPQETPEINFEPWMDNLKNAFGFILRLLVVLVILTSLGFVFYRFWKSYRNSPSGKMPRKTGKVYANPVQTRDSPESLFAMSEDFFRDGFIREAWAACLAGCTALFSRRYGITFPAGTTEYGCLERVHTSLPGEELRFSGLVHTWIHLAYGGRIPDSEAFNEALSYGRSLLRGPDLIGDHDEP